MLQLLQWKNLQKSSIPDILNRFTYVPSIEILKFLKESFDAMFAILENADGNDMGVYHALTYIIGIMVNTTSINLRPGSYPLLTLLILLSSGHIHHSAFCGIKRSQILDEVTQVLF